MGLGAWALATPDPPGRVLVGLAALALAAVAVFGARARPRLAVDDEGLTVRGVGGARQWPWERVDAVRVVRTRRLGVPAAYLEVETGGRLLVLGRLELGEDPVEVASVLQEHRARAGRRSGQQHAHQHEDEQQRGEPGDGEGPRGGS